MTESIKQYKAKKIEHREVWLFEHFEVCLWLPERREWDSCREQVIPAHIIEDLGSGAIIAKEGSPGRYDIEASTASGRRRFRDAIEVATGEVQSDEVPSTWDSLVFDKQLELFKRNRLQWGKFQSYLRFWRQTGAVPPGPSHSAELEESSDPELTPERVLRELENSGLSNSERGKLVVEAELLEFSEDQTASLTKLLRRFIDECRESNVPSDLVAVASAIRKFIATASTEEAFDYSASLLRASSRAPLSIELELEVTKMVVRKLTANPPATDQSLPDLAARLKELCETYLNPRLLARENHGAIALKAVLGLVLTRDRAAIDVIGRVRGLNASWFQKLVGRRASRLKTELEQRGSIDRYRGILSSLDELSELVLQKTPT